VSVPTPCSHPDMTVVLPMLRCNDSLQPCPCNADLWHGEPVQLHRCIADAHAQQRRYANVASMTLTCIYNIVTNSKIPELRMRGVRENRADTSRKTWPGHIVHGMLVCLPDSSAVPWSVPCMYPVRSVHVLLHAHEAGKKLLTSMWPPGNLYVVP